MEIKKQVSVIGKYDVVVASGGLGVDVYSKEPFDESHPFNKILDCDNVLLTPHMAWGSYEARNRCIKEIAQNMSSFFKGERRNRIV